ncbi:zinc ABC transporter permease AztB [Paramicrobacterium agarici]|uniref:zinc ABC transporter permease AztB n=1 Tax=Paramicrobacterium agarici TaxID=630514 RepID=UPI0011533196|nr:zinc ABC transporter permease AztB [Microbacterium agarici]TQO22646.1 zinc/manganese transport system permease protein/manganese/iron transport system permease protein [Microbacterium agarici]
MSWLIDPLSTDFVVRAALGGMLVAVICGVVGTWVVIRGMAFLGEAIGHGMLPGVALASVLGLPLIAGAAVSALVMSAAIGMLQRRGRLSYDTSIGLLFVGMLSLGVIIVSHSRSFATDATAMLFGDILAIAPGDIVLLVAALAVTLIATAAFHRAFVAAAFDRRIAQTLGLAPHIAQSALVGLVTLAVVVSFQAVGTLLVVGLLIAPVVAARPWAQRIPVIMTLASGFGVAAVLTGLLVSWHIGSAAGASIACSAIALAAASALVRGAVDRVRRAEASHRSIHGREPAPSVSPPPSILERP